MAETNPLVKLTGVTFRYPGASRDALRDVDIEFERGRVTLVTGQLGAGCSSVLLVAADLAPRVIGGKLTGSVAILGQDTDKKQSRSALAGRIGLLLPTPWTQLSGMSYTVREEIAFGPSNLGRDRHEIAARVDEELERVGITHLADRDPSQLSGGELQKVMFAAVLAMDPEVLLLDEPAVELDPPSAEALYALLPTLARERAVVVASTDVDRIWGVADSVVLMEDGTKIAEGRPDDVLRSPAATSSGATTTVGLIFDAAGVPDVPLSVSEAVNRFGG